MTTKATDRRTTGAIRIEIIRNLSLTTNPTIVRTTTTKRIIAGVRSVSKTTISRHLKQLKI
jgi:hypothetical protein